MGYNPDYIFKLLMRSRLLIEIRKAANKMHVIIIS